MKSISNRLSNGLKLFGVIAVIAVVGISLSHLTYAATGSLTFSPSSGSYTVGNDFTVTVTENSGTDAANTVDAAITFPSSLLQFVSDTAVAPFSTNPSGTDSASGNSLLVSRASLGSSSTGAQTVTVITFKVLAAGSAPLAFDSSNSDILSATDHSNLLTSSPGVSYTLAAAPTGGGTGGGGTGGGGGGTTPTPAPAAGGSSKGSSVNVSSTGSTAPVTVPNGSTAQVSKTVGVEPATIQTQGVSKIEYYLDGKLVDTETVAPYTYNVDTTKLKNGTHVLLTKTYYTNGTTKSSSQNLVITDGIKASKTAAVWTITPVIIVLVVIGVYLYTHIRRRPVLMPAGMNQAQPTISSDNPVVAKPTNPTDDILHNMHTSAPPPSTVIQPEGKPPVDPHNPANG